MDKLSRSSRKVEKIIATVGVAILAVYVVAYVINSSLGGYYLRPMIDGSRRYSDKFSGLGLPLAYQWQPKIGFYCNWRRTFAGYIFLPMISLDRMFWHKTHYADDPKIDEWVKFVYQHNQVHPYTFHEGDDSN